MVKKFIWIFFVSDSMTDETEEKILDSALREFSEKGYSAATGLNIAKKAGFSEKTLFRKFKTKKNLFNTVITQNNDRIMEDFNLLLVDDEFKTVQEFLEVLVKDLADLVDNHFDFVYLTLNESRRISKETAPEKIPYHLGKYMEKYIQNEKIDYPVFAMTILSFLYSVMTDKHKERSFVDHDDAIEKFIGNLVLCLE